MLLAAFLLAVAMLGLPYLGALRAWYNRYCLDRQGPQLVQALPEGELRAVAFSAFGAQARFSLEAVLHQPTAQTPASGPAPTRFMLLVELDCERNTSQVLSGHNPARTDVALPGFFGPDRYPVSNGAGWRYALQQQYCG